MIKFILKEEDKKLQEILSKECNISPITAQILINRGFTNPEDVLKFFDTSLSSLTHPFKMKDLEKASIRIVKAIKNNEKIAIFGDYDVDGITSTALFINFFNEINFKNFTWYIPSREEGYGLNINAIKKFSQDKVNLLITVDCGIQNFNEVDYANEKNIEVIITDHHEPGETLPNAFAIINPKQKDCEFPFKELAGVGVAYYLIMGIRIKLREFGGNGNFNLKKFLDLVAIGTVADISPLIYENRIFVKSGLKQIENSINQGIKALTQICHINNKSINCWDVGFKIAPRLNAAGRISDPKKALLLLITNEYPEALKISQWLCDNNYERQKIEEKILNEAIRIIESNGKFRNKKSIILYSNSWHEGVIGIVSAKLVEKYYKPVILITFKENGTGKGSARSIKDIDIFKSISFCEEYLESYGGHKLAAGLTIKRENIQNFIEAFENIIEKISNKETFIKKIFIDKVVNFRDINFNLMEELMNLSPFGPGNEEPLFFTDDILVTEVKSFGLNHINLKLEKNNIEFDGVAFNLAHSNVEIGDSINVTFTPFLSFDNGEKKIKLKIKNIKKR